MNKPNAAKRKPGYSAVTDGDLTKPIGLTEFMNGLGLVLKLPRRRPTAPVPEETTEQTPKAPRSRTLVISLTLASIIALVFVVQLLIPDSSDPLPEALTGSWYSSSPRYANRGIEFHDGALYMKRGIGDTNLVRLPIQRVRVRPKNDRLEVQIGYVENGSELSLDLTLHDYGGLAVVELRNMPDVLWRKAATTPNGLSDLLPPALAR